MAPFMSSKHKVHISSCMVTSMSVSREENLNKGHVQFSEINTLKLLSMNNKNLKILQINDNLF